MQRKRLVAVMVVLVATAVGCAKETPAPEKAAPAESASADKEAPAAARAPAKQEITPELLKSFGKLPEGWERADQTSDALVSLGRMLYFEARLSKNHDVSCNTCHDLAKYGVDSLPTSKGHKGVFGGRNAPTVYNAAGHLAQFWDGRAADVEAQAIGPILNPVEMAMPDEATVLKVLKSIPGYVEAFAKAFPGEGEAITYAHVGDAIGAYERKLATPSVWDAFQAGDEDALSQEQKDGLLAFLDAGCIMCHGGPLLGGHVYQKLGLVRPWPADKSADLGRFDVTKNEAEKHFFKVPSLRNIDKTGPYFHDGSVASLDEAVKLMAAHQLGKDLGADQVKSIVTFLGALTGPLPPASLIAAPELPPSGPDTPAPDPS